MAAACATCASPFTTSPLAPASEKPLLVGRDLPCCARSICARCLNQNKRYETYCPYCQISTAPSLLPQGLKDPPAYESFGDRPVLPPPPQVERAGSDDDEQLPAYSAHEVLQPTDEKRRDQAPAPDVLHFLTPSDSMHSLSLAYGVPLHALRRTNNVYADHLIQGRRTLLIPGEYYKGGVSLSPRPLEGEEEEVRKGKVRRWMVGCKVAEYDVALLYLQQAEWNLDVAVEAYKEDERWEREHPLDAKGKGGKGKSSAKVAGMRRFVGGGGQTGR